MKDTTLVVILFLIVAIPFLSFIYLEIHSDNIMEKFCESKGFNNFDYNYNSNLSNGFRCFNETTYFKNGINDNQGYFSNTTYAYYPEWVLNKT